MTNERAVEILNLDLDILGQYGGESAEAYKMAIQALEQQPSDSNITDSCDGCRYELNSTNGEPCYSCGKYKLTEQQPSEDCISREEVQDLISRWLSDYLLDETREALETINYKVGDMPPVKPKRPKGKWMECGGDEPWLKGYCCSLCNFTTTQKYDYCTCGAEMEGEE